MGREGHHAKIFRQTFISHSNFAHLKPLLLYHIPIFFIKNTAENPAFPLGFSAVILFSCLCSDFRPVLEGHPDIVFAVHCDEIHQAAPQPGIELLNEILIPKLLDEAVHLTAPGLAILDGFTGLVVLRLRLCLKATPLFPGTKKAGHLPTFAKPPLYMDFSTMHTVPNIVSIPSIFARTLFPLLLVLKSVPLTLQWTEEYKTHPHFSWTSQQTF